MRRSLAAVILMATTITLEAQSLDFTPNYPDTVTTCQGDEVTLTISGLPAGIEEVNASQVGNVNRGPKLVNDSSGNLYVLSAYSGSFQFRNVSLPAFGQEDLFLAKLDPQGDLLWIISGGSNKNDTPSELALHPDGGVVLVGSHLNPITWTGTNQSTFTGSFTSSSNSNHRDGFALKVSSTGTIDWGATLNGGSNENMNGVAVDMNGNVLLAGGFNGCCPSYFNATINGSTNSVSVNSFGSNYGSGVLTKLSASGQILWTNTYHNRDTGAGPVVVDDAGNVYTTAGFRSWSNGTALIHVDADGTQHTVSNPGIGRAFLIKVDSSGQWVWGRSYGNSGSGASGAIGPYDLALAGDELRITGYYFAGIVEFENSNGFTLPSQSSRVGFALKYDVDGDFLNAAVVNPNNNGDNYLTVIDPTSSKVGGRTSGSDQTSNQGGLDAFIGDFDWTNLSLSNVETYGGSGDDGISQIISFNGAYHIGLYLATAASEPNTINGMSGGVLLSSASPLPEDVTVTWEGGSNDNPFTFTPDSSAWLPFTLTQGATAFTDSIRLELTPLACDNPEAANFEASADCYGGPCSYLGCTDISACNFDESANTDDGSCFFPPSFSLGDDRTVCDEGPVTLSVNAVGLNVLWSTGETTPTIEVESSGVYSVTVSSEENSCDSEVIPDHSFLGKNDSSAYFLSNATFNWPNAILASTAAGGRLASFESLLESNTVFNWLPNTSDNPYFGLFQNTSSASYSEPGGGWEWTSGAPLTYNNWGGGEPNNSGGAENYGHFRTDSDWNDIPATGSFRYIMEVSCQDICVARDTVQINFIDCAGLCGAGTTWDPITETCTVDTPDDPSGNCTLFNLQELAEGYGILLEHTEIQDTLIIDLQNQIDDLNNLLNNCPGND